MSPNLGGTCQIYLVITRYTEIRIHTAGKLEEGSSSSAMS